MALSSAPAARNSARTSVSLSVVMTYPMVRSTEVTQLVARSAACTRCSWSTDPTSTSSSSS